MFDIGFSELLVIGVVALIVLGPDKLPTAARTCGLWLGRIRRSVSNIQQEINQELRAEELRRTTAIEKEKLEKELAEMRQPFKAESSTPNTSTTSNADSAAESSTSKSEEQAGTK